MNSNQDFQKCLENAIKNSGVSIDTPDITDVVSSGLDNDGDFKSMVKDLIPTEVTLSKKFKFDRYDGKISLTVDIKDPKKPGVLLSATVLF